jgi:uncharacterized protein
MIPFIKHAENGRNEFGPILTTILLVISFFVGLGSLPLMVALLNVFSIEEIDNLSHVQMAEGIGGNLYFALILMPFVIGLAVLLICLKRIHKRKPLTLFTVRSQFDWSRFFFSFLIVFVILFIFLTFQYCFGQALHWNINLKTIFGLTFISLFILPLQTLFEELFFRAYLFQLFGLTFKRGIIPLLITSVLFGLMHFQNPEVELLGMKIMVYYIGTGVFLGFVTLMDDGIELSVGYHTANNVFAALIVTNNWQAFHTDAILLDSSVPSFGWEVVISLLMIQPFLIFLFAKKYKWTNWKSRLLLKENVEVNN